MITIAQWILQDSFLSDENWDSQAQSNHVKVSEIPEANPFWYTVPDLPKGLKLCWEFLGVVSYSFLPPLPKPHGAPIQWAGRVERSVFFLCLNTWSFCTNTIRFPISDGRTTVNWLLDTESVEFGPMPQGWGILDCPLFRSQPCGLGSPCFWPRD